MDKPSPSSAYVEKDGTAADEAAALPADQPASPPLPQGLPLQPPATALDSADWLLLAAFVLTGYCFFSFGVLDASATGIGTSLVFWLPLGATLVYLRYRQVKLDLTAWLLYAMACLSALPFALYGMQPTYLLSVFAAGCLCLAWLAYTLKTLIARQLDWLLFFDWVNQWFVVPFANLGLVFRRLATRRGGSRRVLLVLAVLASVAVSLPLLLLVMGLLAQSDVSFYTALYSFWRHVDFDSILNLAGNLMFGLPLAACLFASVIGNMAKSHSHHIQESWLGQSFARLHLVPQVAVAVPLCLFIGLYLAYFAVMAPYLFSAFGYLLPDGLTYADYARKGFFELITVVVINAFILAALWTLASREQQHHPLLLRIMTALFVLITLLLGATAASKLYLYVKVYGLTVLRFYAGWFLLALALSLLVILVFCFRPINTGRAVVAIMVVAFLVLCLINPQQIVADFNTRRYLDGVTDKMDQDELRLYGLSSLPALQRLSQEAPDLAVRAEAEDNIREIRSHTDSLVPWYSWNLIWQVNYH